MALYMRPLRHLSQCRQLQLRVAQYFMLALKPCLCTPVSLEGRRLWYRKNVCADGEHKNHRESYLKETLGLIAYSRLKYYDAVVKKPLQEIKDSLKALEISGVQKLDIVNNLQVLDISAVVIRHRSHCLKELGFTAPDAAELCKFGFIVSSSTLTLHRYDILPKDVNPFSCLMKRLDCSPQLKDKINAACPNPDELTLEQLRVTIIVCILTHYLQLTDDKLKNFMKSRHIMASCVSHVKQSIEIYENEFNIPQAQLEKRPRLVGKYPEDILRIVEIITNHKLDIKAIVSKWPLVFCTKPDNVNLICRYMNDYGIPSASLTAFPIVFSMKPEYIAEALATLSTWAEFPFLKLRSTFMLVVAHYRRAHLHMGYLKKAGFERCNLDLLLTTDEAFKQHLYRGEETESCKEIVAYLADVLESSVPEVTAGLHLHPLFPETSISNVKAVLTFLFSKGFTRRQIINGLALVLYTKFKVAKMYKALPHLDIAQPFAEWADNDNILQLLLYVIEKGECIFLQVNPAPSLAKPSIPQNEN